MSAKETVQALWGAIQSGDFKTAKSYLSDDFQFSGPVPEPINGEQWMGISAIMKTAFPDLDYHFEIVGVDGDVVRTTHQLSGTHSGDLDLAPLGMSVVPATGKSFSNPIEKAQGIVRNGKVVSYQVKPTEGAGLMGILEKLGVKMPSG